VLGLRKHSHWFYLRLVALLCAAVAAPFVYGQMRAEFHNSEFSWGLLLSLFAFGALGVPLVLSIQSINPFAEPRWVRPSWEASLWRRRQPLLAMHTGAWSVIVLGISTAGYEALIGSSNLLWRFFLSIGLGVLVGVRLAEAMFRNRFLASSPNREA
jgi:hypothetical protein